MNEKKRKIYGEIPATSVHHQKPTSQALRFEAIQNKHITCCLQDIRLNDITADRLLNNSPAGASSTSEGQLEELKLVACVEIDWEAGTEEALEKVDPTVHWMLDYQEKDVYFEPEELNHMEHWMLDNQEKDVHFEPEEPLMLVTMSKVQQMEAECWDLMEDEWHWAKPPVRTQPVHCSLCPADLTVEQQRSSLLSQEGMSGMEVPSNHEEYEKMVSPIPYQSRNLA